MAQLLVGLFVLALAACGGGSADRKLALTDADELAARVCAVALASPCYTHVVKVRHVAGDRWLVQLAGGANGVECDTIELETFSVSSLRGVARVPC